MENRELYQVRMNYRRGMPRENLSELTGIPAESLDPLVEKVEFELKSLSCRVAELALRRLSGNQLVDAALRISGKRHTNLSLGEAFQRVWDLSQMPRKAYAEKYGVTRAAVHQFIRNHNLWGVEYMALEKSRSKIDYELMMCLVDLPVPYAV